MRPELELLICCARGKLDAQRKRIGSLASRLDAPAWERVVSLSIAGGIAPLILQHRASLAEHGAPNAVLGRLRDAAGLAVRRNLALLEVLASVLDAFKEHSIAVLPFKGPVMVADLYGDPGLRASTDLDLIVKEPDLERATEVLRSLRFEWRRLLPRRVERRYEAHRVMVRGNSAVELHWTCFSPSTPVTLDMDAVWRDSIPFEIAGRTLHTIAPEMLFAILCVHGAKHRWERLGWLIDLSMLAPRVNWHAAFEHAREMKARRMFLLGAELVRRMLDVPVPPGIAEASARDVVVRHATDFVARSLDRLDRRPLSPLEAHMFALAVLDTATQRRQHIWKYTFHPLSIDQKHLHGPQTLRLLSQGLHAGRLASRLTVELARRFPDYLRRTKSSSANRSSPVP